MGAFLRGLELKMLKKAGIVTITKKKFSIPIRGVGPQNGHQALHMSSHQPTRGRFWFLNFEQLNSMGIMANTNLTNQRQVFVEEYVRSNTH